MGWHLTVMSHGVVLFTATTRSRREIEDLAAEARRLRPDVKIVAAACGPICFCRCARTARCSA